MGTSHGYNAGTRRLFKRAIRERGKISLSKLLYEYEVGSNVIIRIDSSFQKGMPHRRYHGKIGTILNRRGRSYVVSVSQGDAVKEIIVRPEHLEPYQRT